MMGNALLFPPFRLDLRERCLFRDGERVLLRPKSFAVLQYLVEHPGQILSKQEILAAVWLGVRVDHAALKVCIREIRERLGDDPRVPRLIATVHGHGYRFMCPVAWDEQPAQVQQTLPIAHAAPITQWSPGEGVLYGEPAPILSLPSPRPPPVATTPSGFPQPPGVAFSPQWYIAREQEERLAMGYLEVPGAVALLLGPERSGKTWLMKSVLSHLRRQDGNRTQVLEVNLGHFDEASRSSLGAYVTTLTRRIAAQCDPSSGLTIAEESARGEPLERLTEFMEQQVLRRAPERLVLALDSADSIFACPFSEDVHGLFRRWAEAANAEPWSRLRLILAISTSTTLFAAKDPMAPSLTAPIWLGDLRDYQVRQLAERHGLTWTPDECRAAIQILGGQPYLLRLLMHAVICRQVALGDVLNQRWQAARLFDDYLQSLRRRLEAQPALLEAVRSLEGPMPGPSGTLYSLCQAGLLRQLDSGGIGWRCSLYRRLIDSRPGKS